MSDWTVMGRGRRYTFDNPQPALYDRIAAVKALVGDFPVEGRLLFSNLGKFTKGMPKYVMMLDGIEVEFPAVDRSLKGPALARVVAEVWSRAGCPAQAESARVHESCRSPGAPPGRRSAPHFAWSMRPATRTIRL